MTKMKMQMLYLLDLFLMVSAVDPTLKYVQVLFRHGDRTPTHTYPTDPHQADTWPQGWGQLTQKGMQQEYELGQYIKKRYIDTGFIHTNYSSEDIHIVSTYKDRAIMSAYCMLAGLYPPTGKQIWNPSIPWQPIPVFVIPKEDDHILELKCPTYNKLQEEFRKTDFARNIISSHLDLIQLTGKYSGFQPTPDNLLEMIDPIYVEHEHNMTFPNWLMENDNYKKFLGLKDMKALLKFHTKAMAKIRGGPLLGKIMKNFEDVMNFDNITQNIDFYSGHDSNINALLSATGMFNQLHMNYATAVFMELHQSQAGGWSVEFYFRNDSTVPPYLLTVPGCISSCPLSQLKQLTRDVIPEDPIETCLGYKPGPVCSTPGNVNTASLPTGGPTAPSAGFAERHDLDCSAGVMHIHLPLSLFPTHSVTLRDPTCKVTSNGTHLVTDIGLNQCGTTVTFTNDSVIFNNDLLATASNNPGATVATIIDFGLNSADQRVPVSCIFPRESRLDFGYIPLQRTAHFYEKQYGHLDFEVRHYQTEQYRTLVPNTGLPVGVPLNTEVFIDLFVDQTNHKGVGIFVDSCIATPTTNPADPLWYPLVKDGCPMQADVRTFTTPDVNEFRFSFLAFKFTRAPLQKPAPSLPPSPMVYLHCQVSACPSGNCSTSCHSPSTRTRRSADQQKSHLISTGPFYLKTDDHDQEGYSTAVVVATMSVAAVATLVAMVAIVAWRRSANKLSKYRASTMDVTS